MGWSVGSERSVKPTIDPEFQALIPPLTPEESAGLEDSVLREGVRDALVVTQDGVLLDGHNRLAIAERHDLEYRVVQHEVVDRSEAMEWIIRNQFGRRNLPIGARLRLAVTLEDLFRARGEANMRAGGQTGGRGMEKNRVSPIGETLLVNTEAEVAKVAGVGQGTVQRYKAVLNAGDEKLLEKVHSGEATVNAAYKETKKKERVQEKITAYQERKKEPTALSSLADAGKTYEVIVADPPWRYNDAGREGGAEYEYSTMPLEEIKALPVESLAEEECVLFLWATNPMLPEALEVMDAWGFEYKTSFVWDKVTPFAMGSYHDGRHEYLLLGTRGGFIPMIGMVFESLHKLPNSREYAQFVVERPPSILVSKKQRHSQKPEIAYEMIENLYPLSTRLELFARESRGEDWDVWGNEVE